VIESLMRKSPAGQAASCAKEACLSEEVRRSEEEGTAAKKLASSTKKKAPRSKS
jgi:hypothetical protein